ncbi:MAG: hypothetical protein P8N24_01370 [Hellea sp.]|nr:hypothetical protein [Hellea sp.]
MSYIYENLYKTECKKWLILRHNIFARPGHAININQVIDVGRSSNSTCSIRTQAGEYEIKEKFETVMEEILK